MNFDQLWIGLLVWFLIGLAGGITGYAIGYRAALRVDHPRTSQYREGVAKEHLEPKQTSVVQRWFTESTSYPNIWQAPRMGILRKLWVAVPLTAKRLIISVNGSHWADIDVAFLPHMAEPRECVHLERIIPALANFNLEAQVSLEVRTEPNPDSPDERLVVHRQVDQIYIW